MDFEFHNLDSSEGSLKELRAFYSGLYTDEFPDEDERESLENMERYLRLKQAGWYGRNNYHIILASDARGIPVGGVIGDYLADPNVGVIEFIVSKPSSRGQGLAKRLLEEITGCYSRDSESAGHEGLAGLCGEVNDPYRRCDVNEHLDGFTRLSLWNRFGFGLLDFPYVQPPLSEDQQAVVGIALMFRPLRDNLQEKLPSGLVERIVREFQIWAMRIPDPDGHEVFMAMRDFLRARAEIRLIPMLEYIAAEDTSALTLHEFKEDDSRFAEFAVLYQQEFHHDTTAVDVTAFRCGGHSASKPVPFHYWLWGIEAHHQSGFLGFASFFTFSHCGFGGYLALTGKLQGKGLLRGLLRSIERRMVESSSTVPGWYVECEPASPESAVFQHCGFTRIPFSYLQPRLHTDSVGISDETPLDLLYKPFGRIYSQPILSLAELKRDLVDIFRIVYRLNVGEVVSHLEKFQWPPNANNVIDGGEGQ